MTETATTKVEDRIVDKLRKILALTTSPVEGEAQAAAEHLQRLLEAYNLSVADLEKRGASAPAIREDGHDLGKAAFKWKLELADAIADHFYCVSLTDHRTKTVRFAGRPDNIESLQALYAWIIEQIKQISAEQRRVHQEQTGEHVDPLRWQVNFGLGAVGRLGARFRELREKREADAKTEGATSESTALVRLTDQRASEVSDYLEEKYGYRRDGKETRRSREYRERYEARERAMEQLKLEDPDAYFRERPWERPLTPEQEAERKKQEEKDRKRRERNARRRTGRYERDRSPEEIRRDKQAWEARDSGYDSADRVNIEPFLGTGRKNKGEIR